MKTPSPCPLPRDLTPPLPWGGSYVMKCESLSGSSLCEQHKDHRYRTEKSPAEKTTSMAYSVKYYPWSRPRLPAVNDSGNFRLEWIFIGIYVVSLTDL